MAAALATLAAPAGAHAGGQLTIDGHVGARDGGGTPVPLSGATVTLKSSDGSTTLNSTTTNGDGNYSFLLDPGSYRVIASMTGYVEQCRTYSQVGSPTPFTPIELPTTGQAGTLNGTVTDSFTDSPIQDVTVEVGYDHGCAAVSSTVTGSNGGYVFPSSSLPGPVHQVEFSAAGYHPLTQTLDLFTTSLPHAVELDALDVTNPKTTIRSVRVEGRTATVKFRARDPGPSDGGINFTCRLDDGEPSSCESPKKYRHLRKGRHSVRVVAYDAAGNFDQSPAKATFRVG
jgi:Carboxypeptidase regulatory-like domain